jgi:DNA-binding NarL/FixJ family response regulator
VCRGDREFWRQRSVKSTRVLLVDDNPDFLEGVSAWLTRDPAFELAGVAGSGGEALTQVENLEPDVVLMDVAMPDVNGFEATRRIKSKPGAPLVILLTFHDSETARVEALAAGADGFVPKTKVTEDLMRVIRSLLAQSAGRKQEKVKPRFLEKSGPPRDLTS